MTRNLLALLLLATAAAMAKEAMLPGTDRKVDEMARYSEAFCIATFEQLGRPSLGAPGETFYTNARIRVVRNIRAGPFEAKTCSFSEQAFPPGSGEPSESTPNIGQPYLMIGDIVNGELRIGKLADPTSENVELVKQVLRERGVELFVPPNTQEPSELDSSKTIRKMVLDAPTKASEPPQSASPETEEEPASSTPWLVLAMLIVAATGLLWLLLKNRK